MSNPFLNSFRQTKPFIVEITIPAANTVYTLSGSNPMNAIIDWGDGSVNVHISNYISSDPKRVHTYKDAGVYRLKIRGNYPNIHFDNITPTLLLTDVVQFGDIVFTSLSFRGNTALTEVSAIDIPIFNEAGCDLTYCWRDNENLTSVNRLEEWDMLKVTSIEGIFWDSALWNSSAVLSWDTSNILNMKQTFLNCAAFNQDISVWSVSNVTTMAQMFGGSGFNFILTSWIVTNVKDISSLFANTTYNYPLTVFNNIPLTNISKCFSGNVVFDQDISGWDVSNVTTFYQMFWSATAFTGIGNLSNWVLSTVVSVYMRDVFANASNFNSDLSGWNTSKVTNIRGLFIGATSFDSNLGSWDVSEITDFINVFANTAPKYSVEDWDVSNATTMIAFMGAGYSTIDYDNTLIKWSALSLNSGITCSFSNATYTETSVDAGTTDGSTTTDKLIDSTQNFITTVTVGDVIHNTTNNTFAIVDIIDSDTLLTLSVDIMSTGEDYVIQSSAAAKARAVIVLTFNWNLTDGGSV